MLEFGCFQTGVYMKKIYATALIGLSLNACFFNNETTRAASPADQTAAQNQASTAMNQMMAQDPTTLDQATTEHLRGEFQGALAKDPNNGMANFGMAMSLLMSVQYDSEVQKELGSAQGQGAMLARASQWTLAQAQNQQALDLSEDNLTLSAPKLQSYVESKLLPRLDSARSFLNRAIANQGSSDWTIITNDQDTVDIDNGDLNVASAGLNGVRAALNLVCLYDINLSDASGTMAWVDQAKAFDRQGSYNQRDSVFASVAQYNLNRSSFLTWRSGKNASTIQSDLNNAIEDLKKASAFIRAEKDDQSHDLIKQRILLEMDQDYASNLSGTNGFNGNTVDGALARIKDILNGGTITQTMKGQSVSIKPSAFFNPGIRDLKALLPKYAFKPANSWIQVTTDYGYTSTNFEPVYLVDANGQETNTPLFTDYTFGGILPGMTKAKFETVFQ